MSEAFNATRNLEKFLKEPAAPKQDTEGAVGAQLKNVSMAMAPLLRKGHACNAAQSDD